MPEGPSIVILTEELAAARFAGRKVVSVEGDGKIDQEDLVGRKVVRFASHGKHFLIDFGAFFLRAHFLMFGSWCIDARKPRTPRLGLRFPNGELNLYSCALKRVDEPVDEAYDFRTDVMADAWDPKLARRRIKAMPDELACDALLDQDLFAGVGNIIKNEVLFRIRVHPESTIGALPPRKLSELVREAREYSFDFLAWKKAYVLRKHWLAHRKRVCPRCDIPLEKAILGHRERWAYWCSNCQELHRKPGGSRARRQQRR